MFIKSDKYLICKGAIESNMCWNDMCDVDGERETCENVKALFWNPRNQAGEM